MRVEAWTWTFLLVTDLGSATFQHHVRNYRFLNLGAPTVNEPLHQIQRFLFTQAREQPSRPIPRLMRCLTDWTVMEAAWRQVRRSQGAETAGADRVTAGEFRSDPGAKRAWLQDLAEQIQAGSYRPGPVRRFEVAKPGKPGKTRSVAILTLTDRVAHMAMKLVLEPIVEARLGKRCFGFRPGRGRFDELHAIRRVVGNHPEAFSAALTTDIASCFDQLDHGLLMEDLRSVVADPGVVNLGQRFLEQVGSGQRGWWHRRRVGILQGSPLSPLLANWNLARFDRAWDRRVGALAPAFRYADDLVILASEARAAKRLVLDVERCLWRSNRLELAADKTIVADLDDGVPALGLMVRRLRDPFDDGRKVRVVLDPCKVREVLDEVRRWAGSLDPDRPLGIQFSRFNARLRGWFESCQFAHDAAAAFETLDELVFAATRARLKLLLGCSASTVQERHYHRLSTGHHTWQADGVPLLVLGALPRRYFRPKRPHSPWDEISTSYPDRDVALAARATMPSSRLDLALVDARGDIHQERATNAAELPSSAPAPVTPEPVGPGSPALNGFCRHGDDTSLNGTGRPAR